VKALRARKPSSERTKARIIRAARQVLVNKGSSSSASITRVCAAARITRPTFYHYFRSSRALLLAVHMASIEGSLKPYLEKAVSIDDPEARLSFMVRTFVKEIICVYPELRVLIHDSLGTEGKPFREIRTEWRRHYMLFADTIKQIQNEGRMGPDIKPSWAALFLLGMLTWTTYWFDFDRKGSVEAITDHAEKLVFNALGLDQGGILEWQRKSTPIW